MLERRLGPGDFLLFIELRPFTTAWRSTLELEDDDLGQLQVAIMRNPAGAPVVAGTGGLRKLRFAPKRWTSGKRGGVRVCYVYFPAHRTVLLVVAYGKSSKDDLTAAEKKQVAKVIRETEIELDGRDSGSSRGHKET